MGNKWWLFALIHIWIINLCHSLSMIPNIFVYKVSENPEFENQLFEAFGTEIIICAYGTSYFANLIVNDDTFSLICRTFFSFFSSLFLPHSAFTRFLLSSYPARKWKKQANRKSRVNACQSSRPRPWWNLKKKFSFISMAARKIRN